MKLHHLLAVFALAIVPALAETTTPSAGFTALFNGKDFEGWKTAKAKEAEVLAGKSEAGAGRIKVADGIMTYNPAIKGNFYIETTREFAKDVLIKLEFKAGAACNNDFFLRGTKFDIVPGKKETEKVKEGEWQTLEIIVMGDKIEHKINGEVVRTAKTTAASSPFMLRAEFGVIELRNIQVKE
jgi:hypothetical protein